MKTSNKLLLTLALLVLGVFGVVHLTLYARLKAGHIVSVHSEAGWLPIYKGKAPRLVVLEGDINVKVIPSDSFLIQIQEDAHGKVSCRLMEDSLIVKGDSLLVINPHGVFQQYSDRPWITVHAPPHTDIRLNGVLAFLQGSRQPGKLNLQVQATYSQLWLGETYGAGGTDYPNQYYDHVQVQAENCKLVLHQNAMIHKISIRLDELSEINDQITTIDSINIQHTPHSRINLTGANLDKLIKTGQ